MGRQAKWILGMFALALGCSSAAQVKEQEPVAIEEETTIVQTEVDSEIVARTKYCTYAYAGVRGTECPADLAAGNTLCMPCVTPCPPKKAFKLKGKDCTIPGVQRVNSVCVACPRAPGGVPGYTWDDL